MEQKPTINEELAEPVTESPTSEPLLICSQCGAPLANEDVFCPQCGKKIDWQVRSVSDIDDQIKRKPKKKIKILVIILAVILLIAALLAGSYFFFNSKAQAIINELDSDSPSVSSISDDYQALTPIGQFLFRDKIVAAFVDHVTDNPYSEADYVVDEIALSNYADYKEIAQLFNITNADNTNVTEYIDAVLVLKEYEEYNAITKCVFASISSYNDWFDYMDKAMENSDYFYIMDMYIGYAYETIQDAVQSAKDSDAGDALCAEYIDALSTIEASIGDVYSGNIDSIDDIDPAITKADNIISDVVDAIDAVENIVDNLPEIEVPENETAQ